MSVVKVRNDYIEIAYQWIDMKSTYDDITAGVDLSKINDCIRKLKLSQYGSIEDATQLHNELVSKYFSISAFNNAVQMIEKALDILPKINLGHQQSATVNEQHIEQLKMDSFGVLSDVLLKHYVIRDVKEFVEKVSE